MHSTVLYRQLIFLFSRKSHLTCTPFLAFHISCLTFFLCSDPSFLLSCSVKRKIFLLSSLDLLLEATSAFSLLSLRIFFCLFVVMVRRHGWQLPAHPFQVCAVFALFNWDVVERVLVGVCFPGVGVKKIMWYMVYNPWIPSWGFLDFVNGA